MATCECGSHIDASACCEPYISRNRAAQTAEALMRSRYTAFVTENDTYLIDTWHPDTRPANLTFDACRWLGLKIISKKLGSINDNEGWVHFVARYKIAGKAHRIEENSFFVRDGERWLYVSAEKTNLE